MVRLDKNSENDRQEAGSSSQRPQETPLAGRNGELEMITCGIVYEVMPKSAHLDLTIEFDPT